MHVAVAEPLDVAASAVGLRGPNLQADQPLRPIARARPDGRARVGDEGVAAEDPDGDHHLRPPDGVDGVEQPLHPVADRRPRDLELLGDGRAVRQQPGVIVVGVRQDARLDQRGQSRIHGRDLAFQRLDLPVRIVPDILYCRQSAAS